MNAFRKHIGTGLAAAKANAVPALILQAVAVIIGLTYWLVPPIHDFFMWIAGFKQSGGYLYSIVSTALWAGVLPLLLARWQKGARTEPLSRLPFFMGYWGLLGFIIDVFYRVQSVMFGDGNAPLTLLSKICVDMFIFTPLLALPLSVVAYAWKDGDFKWSAARAVIRPGWYGDRIIPVWISCCAVWIPPLGIIYALPPSLQLPIQNLVQCLWVLFLMILTSKPGDVPLTDDMQPECDITILGPTAAPQTANC